MFNLPLSEYPLVVDAQPSDDYAAAHVCCAWPFPAVESADGVTGALVSAAASFVDGVWDVNPPELPRTVVVYAGGDDTASVTRARVVAQALATARPKRCSRPCVLAGGLAAFRALFPQLTDVAEAGAGSGNGAATSAGSTATADVSASGAVAFDLDAVLIRLPDHLPSLVLPHLYLSSNVVASTAGVMRDLAITRVCNVTRECANHFEGGVPGGGVSDAVVPGVPRVMTYLKLEVDDDEGQDMSEAFDQSHAFIAESLAAGHNVLVHCHRGQSRSVAVVINYLLCSGACGGYDEALEVVRKARRHARPNRGFEAQLRDLARHGGATRR